MPTVYWFHLGFFAVFLLRTAGRKAGAPPTDGPAPSRASIEEPAASDPHAVRLIVLHAVAFFVFYFGLGQTLFTRRPVPLLFAPHAVAGGAVIVGGAALLAWTLLVFRSWRLLARIDEGHQLCTTGPFRIVRHPIYLSLDLLAIGTAAWVPGPVVIAGAVLVMLAGDLRARSEERLLDRVFGATYREYRRRVPRTIPGVY